MQFFWLAGSEERSFGRRDRKSRFSLNGPNFDQRGRVCSFFADDFKYDVGAGPGPELAVREGREGDTTLMPGRFGKSLSPFQIERRLIERARSASTHEVHFWLDAHANARPEALLRPAIEIGVHSRRKGRRTFRPKRTEGGSLGWTHD